MEELNKAFNEYMQEFKDFFFFINLYVYKVPSLVTLSLIG